MAKREEKLGRLREAVANAYGFVLGAESVDGFMALNYEELVQMQLDRLTGVDGGTSEADRVQAVANNLKQAIAAIRSLPADAFKIPDGSNVNT